MKVAQLVRKCLNPNHSRHEASNADPMEVLNNIVSMIGEAGEELNIDIPKEVVTCHSSLQELSHIKVSEILNRSRMVPLIG